MQTKKNFIFFLVLLFLLSNCCKDVKHYEIPENQRFKIKQNDTFIYKSNFGNYDTLFIWNEDNFYFGCRKGFDSWCTFKILEEYLVFYVNKYSVNEKPNYAIIKQISSEDNPSCYSFQIDKTYLGKLDTIYVNNVVRESVIRRETELETILINKIEYENVIKVEAECINDTSISLIYVNNEFGLLYYEYCSGEKYELIKYLPSN